MPLTLRRALLLAGFAAALAPAGAEATVTRSSVTSPPTRHTGSTS